jgi:hypothetical protein
MNVFGWIDSLATQTSRYKENRLGSVINQADLTLLVSVIDYVKVKLHGKYCATRNGVFRSLCKLARIQEEIKVSALLNPTF